MSNKEDKGEHSDVARQKLKKQNAISALTKAKVHIKSYIFQNTHVRLEEALLFWLHKPLLCCLLSRKRLRKPHVFTGKVQVALG